MRRLQTERLELVPVGSENARGLWRLLGKPDLRTWQDIPRVRLEEFERQVRSRPRRLEPHTVGRYEWLVRVTAPYMPTGDIGWVSLRIHERTRELGELGYSLIAEGRGFGYATEAVGAIVDEAFRATALDEVQACTMEGNTSSRHVLARVGLREVRLLHSGAIVRGRPVDVLLHAIHRGEWTRAARAEIAAQPRRSGSF
jgi:RimJ/RimL family protein N-acetyltransferase